MPFFAIPTEDRGGRGSNPIITAFGFDPRPGISLPSHMAGRSPIMTTRKRREKLDLGSSKLDQSSSTARRIYQLPVSPCTNQMRHATKCLVWIIGNLKSISPVTALSGSCAASLGHFRV